MAAITDLATASSVATGDYLVINQSGTDRKVTAGSFGIYSSGTWTPDLRFGGTTTGITYSSRGGQYIKIGNLCWFTGWIALSSKGTATGAAIIAQLPFTAANNANIYPPIPIQWISMASSYVLVQGVQILNAAHFDVNGATAATGTLSALQDTAFANSTQLRFAGAYITA